MLSLFQVSPAHDQAAELRGIAMTHRRTEVPVRPSSTEMCTILAQLKFEPRVSLGFIQHFRM